MERITMTYQPPPPAERKVAVRDGNAASAGSATGSSSEVHQAAEHSTKVGELQRLADQAFAEDNVRLSISFEKSIGRFIYRGVDPETGEVVREYPPEEVVERIAAIREIAGVAYDQRL